MNLFRLFLISLFLITCDLSTPVQNDLVDLNKPIVLYTIGNTNPIIEILPSHNVVNNQVTWNYSGSTFTIELEPIIITNYGIPAGQNSPVYEGTHPIYELYLESHSFIEFSNFDSLTSNIKVEIENRIPPGGESPDRSNYYYDVVNPLAAQAIEIQIKQVGEDHFQTITDVNDLINLEFSFKVRLYLRISSGITLFTRSNYFINDQIIAVNDFAPNYPIYRINFTISGFYL